MTAKATSTAPEWNQARERPRCKERPSRPGNIFKGKSAWQESDIQGVRVYRLDVVPDGEKRVPRSFAVVHEADWRQAESPYLPFGLEWQQSLPGRFDVFFNLPEALACLGLGERYSSLNLKGQVHTLSTTDNHSHNEGMDPMYKAIPLLLLWDGGSCRAFFLDSGAPTRWDLDSELTGSGTLQVLTRRGWQLYVLGPAPLPQVVNAYTTLTGRNWMPPRWALGHQQCRWSYPDQETVRGIAAQFRKREIPCDTIVLDIDYMDDYRIFTHSGERFPDFKNMIAELAADDFKVVTIVDPGVKEDPGYRIYTEGVERGLFCTTPAGDVFIDTVWPGRSAFPDFLKRQTRQWWATQHKWFVDNGVHGIWNDMNEPAFFGNKRVVQPTMEQMPPADAQYNCLHEAPEGMVGHFEVRNLYGMLMSRATHEGLLRFRPNERPFVLTRSGYAGVQRYAAVWLGDNMSWFEHLRASIPMLLNVSLSGLVFCGVDIGGFGGDCSPELLVRWYETGIFYPFFRNHSAMGTRAQEPYSYNDRVENLTRKLIETRYRLLPYIQALFYEHQRSGAPLMRPLIWHYPGDDVIASIDDQFMFGPDILVAPVVERGKAYRTVYLPAGMWYPFEGGSPIEGGRTHIASRPLGGVPAYVRGGAVIPLIDVMQSTAEYDKKNIVFQVYGNDTAHGAYFEDDGISFNFKAGEYNEYALDFRDGRLEARRLHKGYDAPHRSFSCRHGNRTFPVQWLG